MKNTKLKKVSTNYLEILQIELDKYSKYIYLTSIKNNFLDAIISIDIISKLHFTLRNKIEKHQTEFTITFSCSEAAVIIKCCLENIPPDPYTQNVFEYFKNNLDKQLKSII